jgi:hypothetical protein
MKRCPTCNRNYTDETLRFCLEDGTPLASEAPPPTLVYGAPPAPPIYAAPPPVWTPTALPPRKRKVWPWVLGAFILVGVLGGGLIAIIIGLAALGSDSTNSNSSNSNTSNSNSNTSNSNSNISNVNRVVIAENTNSTNTNQKQPATSVAITKIYMAKDNGLGKPGAETESFSPSEHTVHVMVELDHAAEGTLVKFDWIAVDAGDMDDQSLKTLDYVTKDRENIVHANLTLPRDWTAGDYKVDVYINGQLARSVAYKIE